MKKIALCFILILSLVSCKEGKKLKEVKSITNTPMKAVADTSIIGTIKNCYNLQIHYLSIDQTVDGSYYVAKNREELLNSIKIKDIVKITNKDLSLVFFTYSIKSDLVNRVMYMRELEGKWFIHSNQYFSEYDDDPFSNGDATTGKEILKKADNWKKSTDNVWWAKMI